MRWRIRTMDVTVGSQPCDLASDLVVYLPPTILTRYKRDTPNVTRSVSGKPHIAALMFQSYRMSRRENPSAKALTRTSNPLERWSTIES